jgi:DNA-3-methyladenine glycosylase II
MKSAEISKGIAYLRSRDPVIGAVIDRVGPFALKPEPDLFKALVRAIIAQQISTGAARSIYKRVTELTGGEERLLQGLAGSTMEKLREAGISSQKGKYLLDLAVKVSSGTVKLERIPDLTNEEIIAELTQVKGIGVWTVHMLLIFSLGRLDVFPAGDFGVRSAIQRLYRKRTLPTKPTHLRRFQKLWQPYASIASWYCWRSLEFEEHKRKQAKP